MLLHEAPDFFGLHKNKDCAFPLRGNDMEKLIYWSGIFIVGEETLVWLAHLVSRFACNTMVIVDASSSPPVSLMSNSCNKT